MKPSSGNASNSASVQSFLVVSTATLIAKVYGGQPGGARRKTSRADSELALAPVIDNAVIMNTASQNLAHHLGVLREKLQHATDYEQALYYFLEEFAGDEPFIRQCEPEEAFNLVGVLTRVAGQTLGKPAALDN